MKSNGLMIRLIIVSAMSVCIGLAAPANAFAAGECKGDVEKYCQGAQGPKQELACLKEHKKQLSPECKAHVLRMVKAAREAK